MKGKFLLAAGALAVLAAVGQSRFSSQPAAPETVSIAGSNAESPLAEAPIEAVDFGKFDLEDLPHAIEAALVRAPLRPGNPAPDFELPDQGGKMRRLSDLRGKRVVLSFYPQDLTYSCVSQAVDLTAARMQFKMRDTVVLGVSVQEIASKKIFADRYKISYPLLADTNRVVARKYRVLNKDGRAGRVTFVIDANGTIVATDQNVHAQTHARDVLAILDRLQPRNSGTNVLLPPGPTFPAATR